MPAEPDNNKIEELLKAYARKRREEGGGAFELHPAVRKMLQGEVARQKPRSTPGASSLVGGLLRFWPRIAFAATAVAVLSLVLWNHRPNRSEHRIELAKAAQKPMNDFDRLSDKEEVAKKEMAPRPVASTTLNEGLVRGLDAAAAESRPLSRVTSELQVAQSRENRLAGMESDQAALAKSRDGSGALRANKEQTIALRDEYNVALARNDAMESSKRLPALQSPDLLQRGGGGGDSRGPASGTVLFSTPVAQAESKATLAINQLGDGTAALGPNDLKTVESFSQNGAFNFRAAPSARASWTNGLHGNISQSPSSLFAGTLLAYDTPKDSATGIAGSVHYFADGLAQTPPPAPSVAPSTIVAAPAAPAEMAMYAFQRPQQTVRARFANATMKAPVNEPAPSGDRNRAYYRATLNAKAAAQPLSQVFDVEQEGQSIRIIDADGSVYKGAIVQTQNVRTRREPAPTGPAPGASRQSQLNFTASGTNKTLKKLVQIKGLMLPGVQSQDKSDLTLGTKVSQSEPTNRVQQTLTAPAASALQGASGPLATNIEAVLLFDNLDASVRLDGTNETRVQANRVSR